MNSAATFAYGAQNRTKVLTNNGEYLDCYVWNVFKTPTEQGLSPTRTQHDTDLNGPLDNYLLFDAIYPNYSVSVKNNFLCTVMFMVINHPPKYEIDANDVNDFRQRIYFSAYQNQFLRLGIKITLYENQRNELESFDVAAEKNLVGRYIGPEQGVFWNKLTIYMFESDLDHAPLVIRSTVVYTSIQYMTDLLNLGVTIYNLLFCVFFATTLVVPLYFTFGPRAQALQRAVSRKIDDLMVQQERATPQSNDDHIALQNLSRSTSRKQGIVRLHAAAEFSEEDGKAL